jgi:proton glutamate symport protein
MENTTPTMIQKLKRVHLTVYILIAMLLGVVIGWGFPTFSKTYLVLLSSSIFLPMVKACIVPLVFSTLVVGFAGFGNDTGRVGRLFLKSMIYFVLLTGLALFIGLAIVNIINPGIGVDLSKSEETKNPDIAFISLKAELGKIFQPSFFQAAVGFRPNGTPAGSGGEILAIVFMDCIFAIAIMKTKDDSAKSTMLAFNRSLSEIMFSVVNIIMLFAPFGVFGAMAAAVGNHGLTVLFALGKLIGALYLGLVIFILLILLPIMLIFKVNIIKFFKALAEPLAIAFSTASSDAALPLVMENMI